jgi:uncharacterized damage-inducible protein DinB
MEFNLDEACGMLQRTPAVLRPLFAGVPREWVRRDEGDGTWTPFDVLGHLIDGEETDWIPRTRIILEQGRSRTFTPFDRLRHLALNKGQSLENLVAKFERLRAENVQTLRSFNLTTAQLALRGVHPELGEVTLAQLLATWVVHDFDHVAQIVRTLARQFLEAVGPWREFMRVLR